MIIKFYPQKQYMKFAFPDTTGDADCILLYNPTARNRAQNLKLLEAALYKKDLRLTHMPVREEDFEQIKEMQKLYGVIVFLDLPINLV